MTSVGSWPGRCVEQARRVVSRLPTETIRARCEEFARARPICAAFLMSLALCGAVPTGCFLAFVALSAFTLAIVAITMEIVLIGIAGIVFLIVFFFVVVLAGGLSVPMATLWLAFNVYRGTPVDFPPFSSMMSSYSSSSSSSSARTSSNSSKHEKPTQHED